MLKNRLLLGLIVIVSLSMLACSKDDNKPLAGSKNDDKGDTYRDWTKKGIRKPAPKPGNVLK